MGRGVVSWWAVALPAVLVGSFEFLRHSLLERLLPPMAGNIVAAVLVGGAAALYVTLAGEHIRRAERSLSASREEAAVLRERDRIAREMHDHLSQALFYMGVRLGDVQRKVEQGEAADGVVLLQEVRQNLDRTYEDVRAAIADLRQHPAPRSLRSCLERLIAEVRAQYGLVAVLSLPVPDVRLPEQSLEHLLGVVQEALVNAAKHAGVREATVSVRRAGPVLEAMIRDQGCGFDPARQSGGFGLLMMEERAELVGGRLHVQTEPGNGTAVTLEIPLEEGKHGAGQGGPGRR